MLQDLFGLTLVLTNSTCANAIADVVEREFTEKNGVGTTDGVKLIVFAEAFPGAPSVAPPFGNKDGVFVLRTAERVGTGATWRPIWRVFYRRGLDKEIAQLVEDCHDWRGLMMYQLDHLLSALDWSKEMSFYDRRRAMAVAQLMLADIRSRGEATRYGAILVDLPAAFTKG